MHSFLLNFTTVIELAATFNLACVAASKTNIFKSILRKDVFKVDKTIEQYFYPICSRISTDKASVDAMEEIKINNGSTAEILNLLKDKYSYLEEQSIDYKKDIEIEAENRFAPKCMDQAFLFYGLYSVIALFIIPFFEYWFACFSLIILNIFSLLVVILIILSECYDFNNKKIAGVVVKTHGGCLNLFVTAISFSFISSVINVLLLRNGVCCEIACNMFVSKHVLYTTIIIPFAAFPIYYFRIKSLSKSLKQYIISKSTVLDKGYKECSKEKNTLDAGCKLVSSITPSESPAIIEPIISTANKEDSTIGKKSRQWSNYSNKKDHRTKRPPHPHE